MAHATTGCVYLGDPSMSSIASSAASLVPTRLPALSGAKASGGSTLGSGSASTTGASGASGDTTSYVTNADGSISITTTNAQGQIVSISTTQATTTGRLGAQSQAAGAFLSQYI
jgi:hypothetical protein